MSLEAAPTSSFSAARGRWSRPTELPADASVVIAKRRGGINKGGSCGDLLRCMHGEVLAAFQRDHFFFFLAFPPFLRILLVGLWCQYLTRGGQRIVVGERERERGKQNLPSTPLLDLFTLHKRHFGEKKKRKKNTEEPFQQANRKWLWVTQW